ncbi:T9SS type A sorting domain-containing protein [Tenacibaculum sp. 190524A02b]|uniref:T9SS type A sorting domain-containing protein n=1 Tax=Tenacibaculum vairaonense TaxID=3137860 RepID=UPI0031FB916A
MILKNYILFIFLIIVGISTPLNAQTSDEQIDPGLAGSFDVEKFDYLLDEKIKLPGLANFEKYNIRIRANVRAPKANGTFPLVLIMHGKHNTCYVKEGSNGFELFPCDGPNLNSLGDSKEIPNHAGYDYLLDFLASHGYIAVSVDTNDILMANFIERGNQNPFRDEAMQARAELLQAHLDLLKNANNNAQLLNGNFVSKIDFNNIITVGHSRGGEGVVSHFIHNAKQQNPYSIKGVFAVAPTNYNNFSHPEMTYAVMLPYCDGDLTDLPGIWNYDRQTEVSNKATHQILLKGANHNYFNTVWTPNMFPAATFDDWESLTRNDQNKGAFCGNNSNRFGPTKQRNILKAYLHSFIKKYVDNNNKYAEPILGTNIEAPSTTQLVNNEVHVSYQAPKEEKVLIHRVKDAQTTSQTSTGGSITHNGINLKVCGNTLCGDARYDDHNNPNENEGLPRIIASWENTREGWFELSIPNSLRNASKYTHLTFRTGYTAQPPWQINRNNGDPKDFVIKITDLNGQSTETTVTKFSSALYHPQGTYGNVTPHNVANTVAIPMEAFQGVDFSSVASIRFVFNQSDAGEVYFTDFAFTNYNGGSGDPLSTEDNYIVDKLALNLFPNPAKDIINIRHGAEINSVKVVNLNGQVLYTNKFEDHKKQKAITVTDFARGIYLVIINNKHHKKLILN